MEGKDVLREQTKRFIAENPTDVVFTRNVKSPDGAGGSTTAPTPLLPQRVRIIQQDSSNAVERRNVAGEMVSPSIKVLFEWDGDVMIGDTFKWQTLNVEVVWVVLQPYEKTAEVAVR